VHHECVVLLHRVLKFSQLLFLLQFQHFDALVRLLQLLGVVARALLNLFPRH
jgi:hypothetical protein